MKAIFISASSETYCFFYPKTSVSREILNITYVSERKRLSFIR